MSTYWVKHRQPRLAEALDRFVRLIPEYLPEARSAALFGGITMGAFSPYWSDIDLIIWLDVSDVTGDVASRVGALWGAVAELPLGDRAYLYAAPLSTLEGPYNLGGGGLPGGPASLRVYRLKRRPMEGYPLSLPDTVSLKRYGEALWGEDLSSRLPAIPADWAVQYLRVRLKQVERMQAAGAGPYGPDPAAGAAWGPDGVMSEHLWYVRQLYSLETGEMIAKEHAIDWYLGRSGGQGPLAEALTVIRRWRQTGAAPADEVVAVARLVPEALAEFVPQALALAGMTEGARPPG